MMRPIPAFTALCVALTIPVAALADKPDHAGKGGKKAVIHQKHTAKAVPRQVRAGRDPVVVVDPMPGRNPVVVVDPVRVQAQPCPPGLAKKSPACIPPGQAKKAWNVGNVVDWDDVHIVSRPGLYGLGDAPRGQRYAIVDGRLVRVDSDTGRILSILRIVEAILD